MKEKITYRVYGLVTVHSGLLRVSTGNELALKNLVQPP